MSSAFWTFRSIVAAIPFVAWVYLFGFYYRPFNDRRRLPGKREYALKLAGLLFGSGLLSWVWGAAILGGLTWGFFVFILSWATVYFMTLVPAALILVVQRIRGREREYDDSQADNPYQGKFFEILLGTRREYSRFLVDKYYRVLQECPDEKKRLIRIATRAVSKDKKNPEARYILGESYLNLDEVAKAHKHASEALRLEPDNDKYKALCAQIEKVR